MERVRDMQQRARRTAEIADEDFGDARPREREKSAEAPPFVPHSTEKPRHIPMPVEMPARKQEYPRFSEYFSAENEQKKAAPPRKSTEAGQDFLSELLKSPDRTMLFMLFLLLQAEGQNEALLMSLLYILS